METTNDDRVLYFRCAETGKRFSVTFRRYSPAHRFQIVKVTAEEPANAASATAPASSTALQHAVQDIQARGLSAVGSLLKSAGQQLVRELGSRIQAALPMPGPEFDVAEFDLAGWYCPHCGHSGHSMRGNLFVQCNRCREYVCGARTRKVGNTITFACHDGCGGSGEVHGSITSYRGQGPSSASRGLQSADQRQIPTSSKRSLPPK